MDAVVDHNGGQEDSAAEGERIFVVAAGDSAPLLQAGVSAFDGVAVAVDERVKRRWTSAGRAFLLAAADLIRAFGDGAGVFRSRRRWRAEGCEYALSARRRNRPRSARARASSSGTS